MNPTVAAAPVEPISGLMLMTLVGALLIGVAAFLWFLRRRSNRETTGRILPEAMPEIVGIVLLACFVMAALTIGVQMQQ